MAAAKRAAGYPIEQGRVVLSRAGHDAGSYFVVMDVIQSGYALLADGRRRKTASPKKKKFQHLRPQTDRFDDIIEKARSGTLLDAHVRSRLANAGYTAGEDGAGHGPALEEETLGQERQH